MKKNLSKKPPAKKKETANRLNPGWYILVMAYLFVPVFTPNFYTFDSAGPKFLALAILNLVSFVVLLSDRQFSARPEVRSGFFRNYTGMAYTLFLVITLLSFFSAINLNEAVLNLVRISTVFATTWILFVIFSSDHRYFLHLAAALSILLVFDSATVFYNILLYISGDLSSIMDIKSVYSHKNILASALFVKLPAAIFLAFYAPGWQKRLGYAAILCAVLATLLLSTRAFYLGLALLLIALLAFALARYMVMRKKGALLLIARWTGLFILAVLLYAAAQRFVFPKNTDTIWNTGIISRLSSISTGESSTRARLGSWQRSVKLIGDHPLTGVGTGNWKVEVLKYENPGSPDFTYMYKNHNDFLEVTAETGLPGGLAYLAVFILILIGFARASLSPATDGERLKLMFLPAFGILAYSVDAFFNFPADRPEIQALFAMYVAAAIVFTGKEYGVKSPAIFSPINPGFFNTRLVQQLAVGVIILLLCASCYCLYLFSRSLHYQRLVKEDMENGTLTKSASAIIHGFPAIPDITAHGEPIAVNKARYLVNENRPDEAIALLNADHASPYDSRRELFLAVAWVNKGVDDSAVVYARRAYNLKPLYQKTVFLLSSLLYKKDSDKQEAMNIMDNYAMQAKTSADAWLKTVSMHFKAGQHDMVMALFDSALKFLPADTAVLNQKKRMVMAIKIAPYEQLYGQIVILVNSGQFPQAIGLLGELIGKKPEFAEAYASRAFCLKITGRYLESTDDINKALGLGMQEKSLFTMRGENFLRMGKPEDACRDFKAAMDLGDPNGAANYKKYCFQK